jgi:hypothetical protein
VNWPHVLRYPSLDSALSPWRIQGDPVVTLPASPPLEGLVETDWAPMTFTYSVQLTGRDWVTYEKGEPICMIVPQRRGEIEQFQPVLTSITNNPELAEADKPDGDCFALVRDSCTARGAAEQVRAEGLGHLACESLPDTPGRSRWAATARSGPAI